LLGALVLESKLAGELSAGTLDKCAAGSKGRFRFLSSLEPLAKQDNETLRDMAIAMNLPNIPPRPSHKEEAAHGAGYLKPVARDALIAAIAEDERGRHALCIKLQALARGVSTRVWMQDKVAVWLQQKEMEKMEAAIEFARTNGAANTVQRVARGHAGRIATREQRRRLQQEAVRVMEARWKVCFVCCSIYLLYWYKSANTDALYALEVHEGESGARGLAHHARRQGARCPK
jgi:hypothetical protein